MSPSFLPTSQHSTFAAYDPVLGWALLPNSTGVLYADEFETNVSISPQGLRDRVYPLSRSGKARIAFVGDSFAWGVGVEEGEAVPKQLERLLGEDFEVMNFGVPGYSTDQELLYLDRVMEFQPDLVILQVYANDFAHNWLAENGHGKPFYKLAANGSLVLRNVPVPIPKKSWDPRVLTLESNVTRFLSAHSHLWVMSKNALKNAFLFLASDRFPGQLIELSRKNSSKIGAAQVILEKKLILEFKKKLGGSNAKMLLVYAPLKEHASQDLFEGALEFYGIDAREHDRKFLGTQLHDFAEENGVPFVDLGDQFEGRAQEYYFKFDMHLTPKGNEAAAQAILPAVRGIFNNDALP